MALHPKKAFCSVRTVWAVALFSLVCVCIVFSYSRGVQTSHRTFFAAMSSLRGDNSERDVVRHCEDVLTSMTKGRWVERDVSPQERAQMEAVYKQMRGGGNKTAVRGDLRCGNLSVSPSARWTRALCDEHGDTPCCFHNKCVNRTVAQCTCAQCYDLRRYLYAELATWQTQDPRCQPKEMSTEAVCRVLAGWKVYFIGDSLVRHTYTSLLLLVRGNTTAGAFRNDTPQEVRKKCSGMFIFTWTSCRTWLDTNVSVCNGSTHLQFHMLPQAADATRIHKLILSEQNSSRNIVFLGQGIWNGFNARKTTEQLLLPLLKKMAAFGGRAKTARVKRNALKDKPVLESKSGPNSLKGKSGLEPKRGLAETKSLKSKPTLKPESKLINGELGLEPKSGSNLQKNKPGPEPKSGPILQKDKPGLKPKSGPNSPQNKPGLEPKPGNVEQNLLKAANFQQILFNVSRLNETTVNPKLVWLTTHCQGVQKIGHGAQDNDNVLKYNRIISEFLGNWGVPVFDSFGLTAPVRSIDGVHFAVSVNKLKAQVLLHYIATLS